MKKSEERNTEYIVIARPFYREHPPIAFVGYAKDEEEAMSSIIKHDNIKEILDCKVNEEINWNNKTALEYWRIYSTSIDAKRICSDKQLF